MSEAASGLFRQRGTSTCGRTLEQLQTSRRRAGIAGGTESSVGPATKENQIRHYYIHPDLCDKGHSYYDIYRATKDTVHVICILIYIIRHIFYAYYY